MSRPNPHWDADFGYGSEREASVLRILRLGTLEFKSDRKAATTGNIFVEVFQGHGGRGGLSATKADHWMIEVLPEVWVLLSTQRLKSLARWAWETNGRRYAVCRCGCGNKGVLIPVQWITQPLRVAA